MSEVGTLKELGVSPGDRVQFVEGWELWYPECVGTISVVNKFGGTNVHSDGKQGWSKDAPHLFRIVSRATPTPKLWRDLTPAEKGALLLAHQSHPGSVEFQLADGRWIVLMEFGWRDNSAYRIKPVPKVETVTVYGGNTKSMNRNWGFSGDNLGPETHRITFQAIDGKPDCASVKMEEI